MLVRGLFGIDLGEGEALLCVERSSPKAVSCCWLSRATASVTVSGSLPGPRLELLLRRSGVVPGGDSGLLEPVGDLHINR